MQKLSYAINFSAKAHKDQRRKDEFKTPYINHPIEVMDMLSQAQIKDIDTLCAAVLHDTVEDTDVTYEDLIREFGENVANIVMECSDDKSLPKEVRKQEQIKHSKHISDSAKLVKIADKLSNLSGLDKYPPTKWSSEEIEGYFVWSYAVWLNLRGLNEILDKQMEKLFQNKNLMNLSEKDLGERLEKYYENIKESE